MTDQKKRSLEYFGRLVLIGLMLAAIFYHEWIMALAILAAVLVWRIRDHFRYERKGTTIWFSVDFVGIVLLFAIPLSIGAYSQFNDQRHPSASQIAAYERNFDVVCLKWRDGNWFDRNIGQYRDRSWCRDYVHRLPDVVKQTAATATGSDPLWK